MEMNSGKILPAQRKKQSGQTLVEFALLLLVISSMSFIFLRASNINLAKYWQAYARLIVDDPSQNAILSL
jgi:hypothetical protein